MVVGVTVDGVNKEEEDEATDGELPGVGGRDGNGSDGGSCSDGSEVVEFE